MTRSLLLAVAGTAIPLIALLSQSTAPAGMTSEQSGA